MNKTPLIFKPIEPLQIPQFPQAFQTPKIPIIPQFPQAFQTPKIPQTSRFFTENPNPQASSQAFSFSRKRKRSYKEYEEEYDRIDQEIHSLLLRVFILGERKRQLKRQQRN